MFVVNEKFWVLEDTVEIVVGSRSKKWFSEKLGREVQIWETIQVTPDLIPLKANIEITGICPLCGKHHKTLIKKFSKYQDTYCVQCRNFLNSNPFGKTISTLTVLELDEIEDAGYDRIYWVKCSCSCESCTRNETVIYKNYHRLHEGSSCKYSKGLGEKCSVEGCEEDAIVNGFCRRHNQKFLKYGDPLVERVTVVNKGKKCFVPGCEGEAHTKGFCKYHYDLERMQSDEYKRRQKISIKRYHQSPKGVLARKRSSYNRRAIKLGAIVEEFSKLDVYERDNWICQLCGLPVDPSLESPDPKSASLDHVVPLTRGGSHTFDNVQLAHRGCNSSKHNKLPEEYEIYRQQQLALQLLAA